VAVPKGWILLDSKSTADVFLNPRLSHNLCEMKRIGHGHRQEYWFRHMGTRPVLLYKEYMGKM